MSTTHEPTALLLLEVPFHTLDHALDAWAHLARAQARPWDPVGGAHEGTAALDSATPGHVGARWSWALGCPLAQLRGRVGAVSLQAWERGAWRELAREPDPFRALHAMLLPHRALTPPPDAPPFVGGAVGLFGYACRAASEPSAGGEPGAFGEDDLWWGLYDTFVALDAQERRAWVGSWGLPAWGAEPSHALARERVLALAEVLALGCIQDGQGRAWGTASLGGGVAAPPTSLGLAPSLSPDEHRAALARILGWIGAGDLYQACFTYPMWAARPPALDARTMFAALRVVSPAPFAALVVPGGPLSLAGASPERFLQVRDRVVQARPMKGTRPRLGDPLQDDAQRQDLRDSLKDRAENVMIVDLMRNDLGRVCALGSVWVPDLFTVETYRAVHQMTSTVRGTLAPDAHALDAVRACFPPGSMTGAPKVAAMQRLQTLETSPRGWYSGALGYLGFDGDADLCVVIRSALLSQDRLAWHVGGGIVADSDFEAEWLESLSKCPPSLRGA